MAAAMAYCTSNPAFYQHPLTATRNQFTPVARRTNSSPSTPICSTVPVLQIDQSSIMKTIKSDENNNSERIDNTDTVSLDGVLHIISDEDDDGADGCDNYTDDNYDTVTGIDEEEYLACVGLRPKTKKVVPRDLHLRSLTKRLAFPVCLLPLPKYIGRVRQALHLRLPFLKFLSITSDIERFCSTDADVIAENLLLMSIAQARTSYMPNKSQKKRRSLKTDSSNSNSKMPRAHPSRTSMSKYVSSILQCQVVLDRLEQTAIDQIIQNSIEEEENVILTSTPDQSLRKNCKARRSLSLSTNKAITTTRTTVTTTTTQKTIIKRKSTPDDIAKPKRAKLANNNFTNINDDSIKNDSSVPEYERIYLKCFVCSKREYVDSKVTDSDTLHSHWLEHDKELSLNIYDSEIDSILTRVVEFFNTPRKHVLEGRIKTVFILNSKEVQSKPTINSPPDDACIVID